MTVRFANEKDIPRMGDLLRQVCGVHAALRPDLFIPGGRKYTDSELSQILKDPARPILAAADGEDRMVGYAFCEIREQGGAMQPGRELYLDDLCVDASRRGQGVGSALFEAVTALAKERGCGRITLNVWAGNAPAEAFYRSRGMTVMKTALELRV